MNTEAKTPSKGRPAIHKDKAAKQAAYRARKLEQNRISQSYFVSEENRIALHQFLESKQTGQGQFSNKSSETASDVVNRALTQFFRKR